MKKTISLLSLLLPVFFASGQSIERFDVLDSGSRPQVMVLGVFHFAESGDEWQSDKKVDILSDNSQEELKSVIESIALFRPTKIMVELDRIEYDNFINEQYSRYISGNFDLCAHKNEVYQLAFPLAAMLGHGRIYCSDASAEWFGTEDIDWDNFDEDAYLESRGQLQKTSRHDYHAFYEYDDSLKMALPMAGYLRFINRENISLKFHQVYLTDIVLAGVGDNYYGADSAGKWYRRNLRIFSNMYDFVDLDAGERIVMIYGASHIWTLKQFIEDSPDFIYVPASDYLPE